MNFKKTDFYMSKGITSEFTSSDYPQIILCGKSNVGKSTFINKLCGNNKLARVGSTPGKTVTVNYYLCDKSYYIVDLPGYGYARRSAEEQIKWDDMMARFFESGSSRRLVILLVDSRRGMSEEDFSLLDYVSSFDIPVMIVLTKTDKLTKSELSKVMTEVGSDVSEYDPISVCYSSSMNVSDFDNIAGIIDNYFS